LAQNSGTGREGKTAGEGSGSRSTSTDRETRLSICTKVQQITHSLRHLFPGVGGRVCEIRNDLNDPGMLV